MTEEKLKRTVSRTATIKVLNHNPLGVLLPEPLLEFSPRNDPRPTIVLRSDKMGEGDPELGEQLMLEFLQALLAHPEPPAALLCYNSGVRLTLENSKLQTLIAQLAARGGEVLVCRTSLHRYASGQQPAVGRLAAIAELTERMRQARHLLWP